MDNNLTPGNDILQPAAPDPLVPPTPPQQTDVSQPGPVAVPPAGGGNKKMMFIIIGVVILLLIAGGAVAFFMLGNKPAPAPQASNNPGVDVSDLKTQANDVKDEDIDSDFQQVDSDLQGL